jgi:hypothetical protein
MMIMVVVGMMAMMMMVAVVVGMMVIAAEPELTSLSQPCSSTHGSHAAAQAREPCLTHRLALGDRQAQRGGEQRVEGQEDKVQQH